MTSTAKRDTIVLCLGKTGSGRSKFIETLQPEATKEKAGIFGSLKIKFYQTLKPNTTAVEAVRLASHPMLFLDAPGVDLHDGPNNVKPGDVQKWLKHKYNQKDLKIEDYVDFILYFHQITEKKVPDEPIPHDWKATLDKFASEKPSHLLFVITMWDKMQNEAAKRQSVQDELRTRCFKRWVEKGADFETYDKTSEAAKIVMGRISSTLPK